MKIDTSTASSREIQSILLGAVAPRPIAFASTIDNDGNPNLSPFSFFNAFSSNPPILIFSPARRGRDNTTKHTYDNVKQVPEVVINVVTYDIVQQMSLSSSDFPRGVNEFEKAGFTAIASESVRPFRVKESPIQFECKVQQVIELGDKGGAGNLIICHINIIHLNEKILNEDGSINYQKFQVVGRMGGDDYIKANKESLFTIRKPISSVGIGIDALPQEIKTSIYLTGNELAQLASVEKLPLVNHKRLISLSESHFAMASSMIANGEVLKALNWLINK
ncbi:MAG: flavin reductase [Bacteroidetes bacterium CG2_30_33_31]|nr:MAG: flavin reductase [Bacteroidetes bacterium CG2_30_33_31]